jgi:hypothetical protein
MAVREFEILIQTYEKQALKTGKQRPITQNEKIAMNCLAADIYNPQSSIIVPVSLFDCFTTHIHDTIIITRTKKFESIYYRIMLVIDDRLTVKDCLSLILPEKEHLYEQKKEQIMNAISQEDEQVREKAQQNKPQKKNLEKDW